MSHNSTGSSSYEDDDADNNRLSLISKCEFCGSTYGNIEDDLAQNKIKLEETVGE